MRVKSYAERFLRNDKSSSVVANEGSAHAAYVLFTFAKEKNNGLRIYYFIITRKNYKGM